MSAAREGRVGWRLHEGATVGVVVGAGLLALGLLTGRFDVAVLALPLLASAAGARPRTSGTTRLTATVETEPGARLAVRLAAEVVNGTEVVLLRVRAFGGRIRIVTVTPSTARNLEGHLLPIHSGPQRVIEAEVVPIAAAAAATGAAVGSSASISLAPALEPLGPLPVSLALRRPNGSHEARRVGQGGEFRDLHPFTPGDRLRRIDWRATARFAGAGDDLIVRRTFETAEASIAIAVDGRDDIGQSIVGWFGNTAAHRGTSSLDIARAAAASLAAGYLAVGDRVAYVDLARGGPSVPLGAGRRHLDRLVAALAATGPSGPAGAIERRPMLPPAPVVHLLSTLLDEDPFSLAHAWAADGRRVIVIDLLPAPRFDRADRRHRIAHRLLMLERRSRLAGLRDAGIEVVQWSGKERDVQLRELVRRRRR